MSKLLSQFLIEAHVPKLMNIEDTLWSDGLYGLNNSLQSIEVLINYLKGKKINTPIIEKLDAIPTLIMGQFNYQPILFDENGQTVSGENESYLLLDHEGYLQFDEKSLFIKQSDASIKNKQKLVKIKTSNHFIQDSFFIATRSVFNKTGSKIIFNESDIESSYGLSASSDLANKLSDVLKYTKELKIHNMIIQGDLLFTKKSLTTEKINDENNIIFRSNTIIYGVPESNSELYDKINHAEIGLYFYAKYVGDFRWIAIRNKESNKIERIKLSADWLSLSNNINLDELANSDAVFYDISLLKDTLSKHNRKKISDKSILELEQRIKTINELIEKNSEFIKELTGQNTKFKELTLVITHYLNKLVKIPGETFNTPHYEHITYSGISKHINDYYGKRVSMSKQEKTKGNKITTQNIILSQLKEYKKELSDLFTIQYHIEYIKFTIIELLNKTKLNFNSFVQTKDGLFFQVLPTHYIVATDDNKVSIRLSDRNTTYIQDDESNLVSEI